MYIKKLFFNFEIEIIFNSEIENSAKEIEHMKSRQTKRFRYKTLPLTLLRQQKL